MRKLPQLLLFALALIAAASAGSYLRSTPVKQPLFRGQDSSPVLPISVDAVLRQIGGMDLNLNHYPSYADYHTRIAGEIHTAVHKLSSASELKTLFIECHRRWRTSSERPQEELQWIDPFAEACDATIVRLADLDSEEATMTLVQLYASDAFGWDASFSLLAQHAISRCGPKALAYLQAADFGERQTSIQGLIRSIQKGELYGP